jgi:TIP49 AAA-lid domain
MQLIITSHLIAAKRKSPTVEFSDIQRAYSLFLDQGRSVDYIQRHQIEFISGNEWEEEEKTELEGGAGTLPMQDVQA